MKYDLDFKPLIEINLGCAILGKEKVMFFNDSTGTLVEVKAEVGDFRTYEIIKVDGKEVFLAGLENAMFAIDLSRRESSLAISGEGHELRGICASLHQDGWRQFDHYIYDEEADIPMMEPMYMS